MKKIHIFINALLYVAFILLTGCYEDDENNFYDVGTVTTGVAEVSVNGSIVTNAQVFSADYLAYGKLGDIDGMIYVEPNDQLTIKLNLSFDNFDPEFEWDMYELTGSKNTITNKYPEVSVISTEQNLNFEVTGAAARHAILCKVTNKENGVCETYGFCIKIGKPDGLAVLYETAEGGDFDFLKSANNTSGFGDAILYRQVFSSTNGAYLSNPNTILSFNRFLSPVLVCLQQDNILDLDTQTYKVTQTDQSSFFLMSPPTYPDAGILTGPSYYGVYAYGVFGGGVYYSNNTAGFTFGYSLDPSNQYSNTVIANVGSAIYTAYFVFFDETNKRFRYGNFNGGVNTFVSSATSLFDINDTGMDLIFAEAGYNNDVNAIMKDADNKLYFCVMNLRYSPATPQVNASYKNDITSLPGVGEASKWSMHTRSALAYYSSGNQVYCYNYTTNSSSLIATVSENVTMLKVFTSTVPDLDSKTLYVGTEGHLYEFTIDVVTGEAVGQPNDYEVGGKVIDVKYIN